MSSHDYACALGDDTPRDDFEDREALAETIAEQRGDAARDDAEGVAGHPLTRRPLRETPTTPQGAHAHDTTPPVSARPAVTLTDQDATVTLRIEKTRTTVVRLLDVAGAVSIPSRSAVGPFAPAHLRIAIEDGDAYASAWGPVCDSPCGYEGYQEWIASTLHLAPQWVQDAVAQTRGLA